MANEQDPKRAAYEAALRGIVEAVHGVVVAFEATAAAAAAWDPDNTSPGDSVQNATITSCRALMMSIIERYPGAEQMLGGDQFVARFVKRAADAAAAAQALASVPPSGSA